MAWVLPVCAGGYLIGIVIGGSWGTHVVLSWLGCVAAAFGLALRQRVPLSAAVLLGTSMVLFGAARTRLQAAAADPRCDVASWANSRSLRLWITVEEEPIWGPELQRQRAWVWAAAADGRPAAAACGRVELTRPRSDRPLWPRQSLVARGRWRAADRSPAPPAGSAAGGRAVEHPAGLSGYFVTAEADLVRLGTVVPRWQHRFRHHLRRVIEGAAHDEPARALLAALVIGDGGRLSTLQRERFGRSGLAHLLAVSGLHLVLVAMALVGLIDALLRRCSPLAARTLVRRCAALIGIAAALLYTALTGGGPATERSCVMSVAVLAGVVLGRRSDLARPLALSALVLLVIDPAVLWRAAFQLSFVAVIGLALAARHPLTATLRRRSRPVRAVGSLALASASASLATAAVTAHHFQTVSLIAPLANLIGVPFVSFFVLPVALVGALLGAVAPVAGTPLLHLAVHGARWLDWFAACAAAPPWVAVRAAVSGCGLVVLTAVALAGLLPSRAGRRGAALVALVALVVGPLASRLSRERCAVVTVLDVSGSAATLLRLPDGETVLWGAGRSAAAGEASRQPLVRWLRRRGIGRLDHVVLTGETPDEIGGLVAVLGAVEVGELWLRGGGRVPPAVGRVLAWLAPRALRVGGPRALSGRDWRLDPLVCEPGPRGQGGRSRPTTRSARPRLALRLRHGRAEVLLAAVSEVGACLPAAGYREGQVLPQAAGVSPRAVVLQTTAPGARPPRLPGSRLRDGCRGTLALDRLRVPPRGALVVDVRADGRLRSRRGAAFGPDALDFDR